LPPGKKRREAAVEIKKKERPPRNSTSAHEGIPKKEKTVEQEEMRIGAPSIFGCGAENRTIRQKKKNCLLLQVTVVLMGVTEKKRL